jgi:MFS family permease
MLDGASSVGVWVACETVLLARSDKNNKALVMSIYAMAIAIGYVAGSGLAWVLAHFMSYRSVFFVAGAIAMIAAVTIAVALDRSAQVSQTESAESLGAKGEPTAKLLWRIKTSCMATFTYGYFQAAVVLFLPIYLVKSGKVEEKNTILITAFFAGGMLVFSSIWARLGDRIGHLRVITALSIVGMSMILGFVFLSNWPIMCAAIFVAGATLASISPVSLALLGHIAHPRDYSRANALYNACYAVGMLIGPPISSWIMHQKGGEMMLYQFAGLWTLFAMLTVVFRKDDPHTTAAPEPAPVPVGQPDLE